MFLLAGEMYGINAMILYFAHDDILIKEHSEHIQEAGLNRLS